MVLLLQITGSVAQPIVDELKFIIIFNHFKNISGTINRTPANTVVVVGAHHRLTGGFSHPANLIRNHPS